MYQSQSRQHESSEGLLSFDHIGDLGLLDRQKIGLFCSVKCPGSLILQTYDLMQELKNADVAVVSGFHSPMEQECLNILMRGQAAIVKCYARSIARLRIPSEYRKALDGGRLLLISPFDEKQPKTAKHTSRYRNKFVAALSDIVFVAHASPGGKTEKFCAEILSWGKPLYTFESEYNQALISMGARCYAASDMFQAVVGHCCSPLSDLPRSVAMYLEANE